MEMFNISEKHSEAVSEKAKIRQLLDKITASAMQIAVATIRTRVELDRKISYEQVLTLLDADGHILPKGWRNKDIPSSCQSDNHTFVVGIYQHKESEKGEVAIVPGTSRLQFNIIVQVIET